MSELPISMDDSTLPVEAQSMTDSSHLAAPSSGRTSGDAAPNAPSAHTPGPWAVNDFREVYSENGFVVAVVRGPDHRSRGKERHEELAYCKGNGRLIAAAPALYVASQKAHDALTSAACFFHGNPQMRLLVSEALSAVKDAIAQATHSAQPTKARSDDGSPARTVDGQMNNKGTGPAHD